MKALKAELETCQAQVTNQAAQIVAMEEVKKTFPRIEWKFRELRTELSAAQSESGNYRHTHDTLRAEAGRRQAQMDLVNAECEEEKEKSYRLELKSESLKVKLERAEAAISSRAPSVENVGELAAAKREAASCQSIAQKEMQDKEAALKENE